jgi:cobalt-zinc-cadmium efflux system protein
LRDSLNLALNAVPEGIETEKVATYLAQIQGVIAVHDLHIWGMSTTETALTCHLVMPDGHPGDDCLAQVAKELQTKFRIGHATIQIEVGNASQPCHLESGEVV